MTMLDQFSLVTVPIELFFNETPLGQGTGFIWKNLDRHYLVTNWHVLSGCDFFTRELIRKDGGRPNVIRTLFDVATGTFGKRRWDLTIRDENDEPMWLVYPGGRRMDIAVLPLVKPELPTMMYPINELANDDLTVEVGMEVFILGYPFKIEPPGYPVWKRGSIASEPDLVRLTTDYMLVDTASRPGMSGSPVIRRLWNTQLTNPIVHANFSRTMTRFVGVYSGRVSTDHPHEAQIGLVWDGSRINDIIAGNSRDA